MERQVETPSAVGAERRPLCQLQAGIRPLRYSLNRHPGIGEAADQHAEPQA